ncbi:MAG: hypothetical protein GY863_10070, partial [bacterium]|nr:hypothetical protein [bacterium]
MRKNLILFLLVFILLISVSADAQQRQRPTQQRDPNAIYLMNKDKLAEYLQLDEKQKKDIFKEIDKLAKTVKERPRGNRAGGSSGRGGGGAGRASRELKKSERQ